MSESRLNSREIVVVGGGVIGLSAARTLSDAGASVTLVERDSPGQGASWAAAGMLAPTAEVDFEETELLGLGRESLGMYASFVERLEDETGYDVDYRADGTLVVGLDRDDSQQLDRLHAYREDLGLPVGKLSGGQARQREPALSPNVHGATWCPEDHQVDPRKLVRALQASLEARDVRLTQQTTVARVERSEDTVDGVVTEDGELIEAQDVVLAAGAWTNRIDGIPGDVMPHIRPVRGEMIAVELGDPPLISHVIRASGVYLVPRSDGSLVIGATSEERGFDDRVTAGGILKLLHGAWQVVPGIDDQAIIEMWTGFRPVSLDSQPVIGPTDLEGLWLATGHGRNGILLAPMTAEILRQSFEQGAVPEAYQEFAPSRLSR
jgi:glycine oxidase